MSRLLSLLRDDVARQHPRRRAVARGSVVRAGGARGKEERDEDREPDQRRAPHGVACRLDDAQDPPRVLRALGDWVPMIRRDVPTLWASSRHGSPRGVAAVLLAIIGRASAAAHGVAAVPA